MKLEFGKNAATRFITLQSLKLHCGYTNNYKEDTVFLYILVILMVLFLLMEPRCGFIS